MNRMTPAYAAGLLDGEGCVTGNMGKWQKDATRNVGIRVDFGMTRRALPILQQLQEEYGGKIFLMREATDRWDEAHVWNINGSEAAEFLRAIQPYVILKAEQVRLALQIQAIHDSLFTTSTGRAQWTEEAKQDAMELYDRIKELNRKGPSFEKTASPERCLPIAWYAGGKFHPFQQSLFGDSHSEVFSGPFPKSGMYVRGILYERRPPALHTAESASSLLFSTPDTAPEAPNTGSNRKSHPSGLGNQTAALLPTPTVDDEGNAYGRTSGAIPGLSTVVMETIHGSVEKDPENPLTKLD